MPPILPPTNHGCQRTSMDHTELSRKTKNPQLPRSDAGFRLVFGLSRTALDQWGKVMVVPRVGLEPTLLAEPDFESGASTNFTTRAFQCEDIKHSTGLPYWPHPPDRRSLGPRSGRRPSFVSRRLAASPWCCGHVRAAVPEHVQQPERDGLIRWPRLTIQLITVASRCWMVYLAT